MFGIKINEKQFSNKGIQVFVNADFIGIGGQRCGTAWIYNCLEEHPQLCLPFKEINFFIHEEKYAYGTKWYDSYFRKTRNRELAGEVSSLYLYHLEAPDLCLMDEYTVHLTP